MPNLIPKNHWSFRSTWELVDVLKILRDANEVNATVVRVRIQFRRDKQTYLFVLRDSRDHESIKHMKRRITNVALDIHPTEEGLECTVEDVLDERATRWVYLVTNNEEDEKRILKLIVDARSFRVRHQRITVECL